MRKSTSKINTSQPSLFFKEEQKELQKAACDSYHFIWENVEFDKGILRLKHPQIIFKPLPLRGALEILNKIKAEYFERLFPKPFKLYFLKGDFQPEFSKDWKKIKELIEPSIEYVDFKFNTSNVKHKIGKFQKLTAKQVFDIYEPKFSKNLYLKHLALNQDTQYRIIPIIEIQNKIQEESFIFRFNTFSNRALIAWENSNEGRATHFFIADETTMESRLKLIEAFIISSTPLKRSMLHSDTIESKKLKKDLMHIQSIMHDSIQSYKVDLQLLINRY